MSVTYSFYDRDAGGQIVSVRTFDDSEGAPDISAFTPENGAAWEGRTDLRRQYFADDVLTERPALACLPDYVIAANGLDTVSFALPAGTAVYFDGTRMTSETDEDFEFVTEFPGSYQFLLFPPFPWISAKISVVAK